MDSSNNSYQCIIFLNHCAMCKKMVLIT